MSNVLQKIGKRIKEKRTLFIILALFWLFVFLVYQPLKKDSGTDLLVQHGLSGAQILEELHDGDNYEQKFTATENNLKQINLFVATYGRENESKLFICIKDETNGKEIYKDTIVCKDLKDYEYNNIDVPVQTDSKGNTYSVTIKSIGGAKENAVSFYLANEPVDLDNEAVVCNGHTQSAGLKYQVLYGENNGLQCLKIAMWMVLMLFSFLVLYFMEKPDEKSFLILAGILGLLFVVNTPFPHYLDENAHFFRSYAISHNRLVDEVNEEGKIGATIADNYGNVLENSLDIKTYMENPDFWNQKFSTTVAFYENPYMSSYIPINHGVAAVGIYLASHLGLPIAWIIWFARLFDLVFYIGCCYFAIRNMKYYKSLFFMVCSMPLAMWLAGSCSQDPVLNGAAILFISICLKYYFDASDKKVTKLDLILMLFCALILASVKYFIYTPILLLFFLIPKERLSRKLFWGMIACIGVIGISCGLVQLKLLKMFPFTEDRNGDVDVARQIRYVFSHFTESLRMFANFAVSNLFYYASDFKFGIYSATKFMGSALSVFTIIFVPVLAQDKAGMKKKQKNHLTLLYLFISVVIIGLIIAADYAGFTPVGKNTVDGVQTRYFIPVILLLMLPLTQVNVENKMVSYEKYLTLFALLGLLDTLAGVLLKVFA